MKNKMDIDKILGTVLAADADLRVGWQTHVGNGRVNDWVAKDFADAVVIVAITIMRLTPGQQHKLYLYVVATLLGAQR